MNNQNKLIQLLKKKGVGPTMQKQLTKDELAELSDLFTQPDINITTKATMLTAILTLEKNPDERAWLEQLKLNPSDKLPIELLPLLNPTDNSHPLLPAIHKAIQHNDLTKSECLTHFESVFNETVPTYLKASFLEAERLKRESPTENQTCFDIMWSHSQHHTTSCPILIDFANAYDGMNRNLYLTPFIACLLASIGFPCILHGIDEVSPKKGQNPYKLLKLANKNPLLPPEEVISQLENPDIGWGYLDQSYSSPTIHSLKECRTLMVKRPILATLEKILQPIRSTQTTLIITSYTHPPYKQKMTDLFNHTYSSKKTVTKELLVRGMEGSIQCDIDRRTPYVFMDEEKPPTTDFISPKDIGINEYPRTQPNYDYTEKDSLEAGINALKNTSGYARDLILYNAFIIITLSGLCSKEDAITKLNTSLRDGIALNHWEKNKN